MELGHLLHLALTRPSSAVAGRLKSRHPFVLAAQHLISFSDNNNMRTAQWADHQWNAEWTDNLHKTPHFHPRHRHPLLRNDPPKKSLGPAEPPPHRCRTFALLPVQMGCGLLCGLCVWRRIKTRRPCCPPMSNPSTSPWTA